jgi:hypothetical protein
LPVNSHRRFRQTTRRSMGRSAFGRSENDSGPNAVPHQGQLSRGIGGGQRLLSFL